MPSTCAGEDYCEELTCAVCLDAWRDPLELLPCGHIFCTECATRLTVCPVCRDAVREAKVPNRTLVNMALRVSVTCRCCGWKGTREQSARHTCPCAAEASRGTVSASQSTHGTAAHGFLLSTTSTPQHSELKSSMSGVSVSCAPALYAAARDAASPLPPCTCTMPPRASPFVSHAPSDNDAYAVWYSLYHGAAGQEEELPPAAVPCRPPVIEPTGPHPWTLYGLSPAEYDHVVSLACYFDADENGTLDRGEAARLARWLNFATTPQDVDRIFNDMDADHNGTLSLGEFLTWMAHNKPNPQALYGLTQVQYDTIMMQFRTYDTNGDGLLSTDEFTGMLLRLREVRDAATARRLFHMLDTAEGGAITLHQFLLFRAGRSDEAA